MIQLQRRVVAHQSKRGLWRWTVRDTEGRVLAVAPIADSHEYERGAVTAGERLFEPYTQRIVFLERERESKRQSEKAAGSARNVWRVWCIIFGVLAALLAGQIIVMLDAA